MLPPVNIIDCREAGLTPLGDPVVMLVQDLFTR